MTKHTGAFVAAAMSLTMLAAPAAAQDSGAVTIYRGAQAETVRFADRGGVTVVRGEPATQPAQAATYPHRRTASTRMDAGDTLWIVKDERLLACQLRPTTQVGGRRIRCIERALPVAFR